MNSRIDIIGHNGGEGLHYEDPKGLDQLIVDHWNYVETVLLAHKVPMPDIDLAKFHYCAAFRHGYKHAVEEMNMTLRSK